LSVRYEIEVLKDNAGYKFITFSGDIYIAYFTEFILLDTSEHDVPVVSFGFTCKRADEEKRSRYDIKIMYTIIHIIKDFFTEQDENAFLYICMNNDGRARHRQITFNKWYNEFGKDIEKHNSSEAHGNLGFYGSILLEKIIPVNKNL
jgi:hypothetical protein